MKNESLVENLLDLCICIESYSPVSSSVSKCTLSSLDKLKYIACSYFWPDENRISQETTAAAASINISLHFTGDWTREFWNPLIHQTEDDFVSP
jgi:hypothetical protein